MRERHAGAAAIGAARPRGQPPRDSPRATPRRPPRSARDTEAHTGAAAQERPRRAAAARAGGPPHSGEPCLDGEDAQREARLVAHRATGERLCGARSRRVRLFEDLGQETDLLVQVAVVGREVPDRALQQVEKPLEPFGPLHPR